MSTPRRGSCGPSLADHDSNASLHPTAGPTTARRAYRSFTGFRWPSTFGALRYRNYRLWFSGQAISIMGMWMQSVAQGWVVYELTSSQFALGFITFARSIPTLFLMLPAGVVADRVSRRGLLLATKAGMLVCAAILASLAATGELRAWHIGVVAFGLGITESFDAPARQALTIEMVEDRHDLANAIALNSTIFNLARVVGPAIGGIVLAAVGAAWCFGINSAGYIAVIAALLMMRLPRAVEPPLGEPLRDQLATGLHYVIHTPLARTIIILVGVTSIFGLSYVTLLPVFAADVLRIGETGLGTLNTAVGVGAVTGSLIVASSGRSRRKGMLLALGSILFPSAVLVFAVSRSLPLSVGALAVVGFGFITQNSTCNTLIQALVPDELRGRVMAIFMLMIYGAMPFGSLLAGTIAEALGPVAALLITAGLCLGFSAGALVLVPSLRQVDI